METDIIDSRGFVKVFSYDSYSGENPSGRDTRRDLKTDGVRDKGLNVAQSLDPFLNELEIQLRKLENEDDKSM